MVDSVQLPCFKQGSHDVPVKTYEPRRPVLGQSEKTVGFALPLDEQFSRVNMTNVRHQNQGNLMMFPCVFEKLRGMVGDRLDHMTPVAKRIVMMM